MIEASKGGHSIADLLQCQDSGFQTIVKVRSTVGNFVGEVD